LTLNESIANDTTLDRFGALGCAVGRGPRLAPGEPAVERNSFAEVARGGRLSEAIRRLNPALPGEARAAVANGAPDQTNQRQNR